MSGYQFDPMVVDAAVIGTVVGLVLGIREGVREEVRKKNDRAANAASSNNRPDETGAGRMAD